MNFLQLTDILKKYVFSSYKNFKSADYTYSDVSFNLNLKPKFASVLNSKIAIVENTFIRGSFNVDKSYELILTSPFIKSNEFDIIRKLMEKYKPLARPDSSEARLYTYNYR